MPARRFHKRLKMVGLCQARQCAFLPRYLCFKKVIVHPGGQTKHICESSICAAEASTIFVSLSQTMGIKVAILSWKSSHLMLTKSLWLTLLWACSGPCLSNNPRSYRNLIMHPYGQRSKDQVLKAPESKPC